MSSLGSHLAAALAGASLVLLYRRWKASQAPPWCSGRFEPMHIESLPQCPYDLLKDWIAEAEAELGFLESHVMVVASNCASCCGSANTMSLSWSVS